MTSTAEKILEAALALPEAERVALVSALEASLIGAADLSAEWKTEIARRIHAVESGQSRLVSGEEAAARVRAALPPSLMELPFEQSALDEFEAATK